MCKYKIDAPVNAHVELLSKIHRCRHPQSDGIFADFALGVWSCLFIML